MTWRVRDWARDFHRALLAISDLMNGPARDEEVLSQAGMRMARRLTPRLSRNGAEGRLEPGRSALAALDPDPRLRRQEAKSQAAPPARGRANCRCNDDAHR